MAFRQLSSAKNIRGLRVLVRVDWNIPYGARIDADAMKIRRSLHTLDALSKRGAVVIAMTHIGRPKKRDPKLSTKRLADAVTKHEGIPMTFLGANLETKSGLTTARDTLARATPGDIFLLENVRFYRGEANNRASLAKAYASLADFFINDAFASCHRAHVSVVGIAKYMPSYAGPALAAEVRALERLVRNPKKPFYAMVGGAKLTTKIGVLTSLLRKADAVFVGGALAHPFYRAQGHPIGKSLIESGVTTMAKKLLATRNLILPTDALVASSITAGVRPKNKRLEEITAREGIGDIGVQTMRAWTRELRRAKTIVWNGPVGAAEYPAFAHGSEVLARAIARRCDSGRAFGVVGGGDTIPIVRKLGLENRISHVSTGGGAMLAFIANNGHLPGLAALS